MEDQRIKCSCSGYTQEYTDLVRASVEDSKMTFSRRSLIEPAETATWEISTGYRYTPTLFYWIPVKVYKKNP